MSNCSTHAAVVAARRLLVSCTLCILGCAKSTPESEVPYPVVASHAIHTPDPSLQALYRTRTGQTGVATKVVISFCINSDGRTENVVVEKSSRDRELDAICRDTVASWRFGPFGDETPCSRVTFQLRF